MSPDSITKPRSPFQALKQRIIDFRARKDAAAAVIMQQRAADKVLVDQLAERVKNRKTYAENDARFEQKLAERTQFKPTIMQNSIRISSCPVIPPSETITVAQRTVSCTAVELPSTPMPPKPDLVIDPDTLQRFVESAEAKLLRLNQSIIESRNAEYGSARRTLNFTKSPESVYTDYTSPAVTLPTALEDTIPSPCVERTYRMSTSSHFPSSLVSHSNTAILDCAKSFYTPPTNVLKPQKLRGITTPHLHVMKGASTTYINDSPAVSLKNAQRNKQRPNISSEISIVLKRLLSTSENFPQFGEARSTLSGESSVEQPLFRTVGVPSTHPLRQLLKVCDEISAQRRKSNTASIVRYSPPSGFSEIRSATLRSIHTPNPLPLPAIQLSEIGDLAPNKTQDETVDTSGYLSPHTTVVLEMLLEPRVFVPCHFGSLLGESCSDMASVTADSETQPNALNMNPETVITRFSDEPVEVTQSATENQSTQDSLNTKDGNRPKKSKIKRLFSNSRLHKAPFYVPRIARELSKSVAGKIAEKLSSALIGLCREV